MSSVQFSIVTCLRSMSRSIIYISFCPDMVKIFPAGLTQLIHAGYLSLFSAPPASVEAGCHRKGF